MVVLLVVIVNVTCVAGGDGNGICNGTDNGWDDGDGDGTGFADDGYDDGIMVFVYDFVAENKANRFPLTTGWYRRLAR